MRQCYYQFKPVAGITVRDSTASIAIRLLIAIRVVCHVEFNTSLLIILCRQADISIDDTNLADFPVLDCAGSSMFSNFGMTVFLKKSGNRIQSVYRSFGKFRVVDVVWYA